MVWDIVTGDDTKHARVAIKMSTAHTMTPHYHHPGFDRPDLDRPDFDRPDFGRGLFSVDSLTDRTIKGRNGSEKMALPPIRQTLPEFLPLERHRDGVARTPPSAISPIGTQFSGTITPPEYVVSPNQYKRRRSSFDEDRTPDWSSRVPRPYATPQEIGSRPQSPASKPWADSDHSSTRPGALLYPQQSPSSIRLAELVETRPTLPRLPPLNLERDNEEASRMQGLPGVEYMPDTSRRSSWVSNQNNYGTTMRENEYGTPRRSSWVPTQYGYGSTVGEQGYGPGSYDYSHRQPNGARPISFGPAHVDRSTSFPPVAYRSHYPETYMRMGDYNIGANGDVRPRKRRGNLPKETTDKLRAWFVAHLSHPYPTEDEKQDLVRQTGLQINQISNWFINARRRQLPTMINNARIESEARNGRAVDSRPMSSSGRVNEGRRPSESEESHYEDHETEPTKRRRTTDLKRGSV